MHITKSQIETTNQLQSDGWLFLDQSTVTMNNRRYSVVRMIRNGKIAVVNSRGGFNGLGAAMTKQGI